MATGSFKLPITSGSGVTPWVRPSDWLAMPSVASTDDKFVGLYAIFPEGNNFAAFLFTTSAGQYQVDWGDGTVTLHNSNTIAQYEYNYASISNSTLTSRGYKQAIITVTPVSGLLRTCDLQRRYVTSPVQNQIYATGFLDCILSIPNAVTGVGIIIGSNINVEHRFCERFQLLSSGLASNFSTLFRNMYRLQSVTLTNTANVTNMASMFENCYLLKSVPLFNTANVSNMSSMFFGSGIREIPLFNTTNATSMSSMFQGSLIKTIPLLNTANVTNMGQMFTSCGLLESIPLINTIKVTTMQLMFQSCGSLKEVPLLNTTAVTTMERMFFSCGSLSFVPLFNTANVTNMVQMFQNSGLQSIPQFNTIKVNNMLDMFSGCLYLQSVPSLNTIAVVINSFGNFANNSRSIDRIQMIFTTTVSIAANQLSRTALVEVFNNLANRSATTSATINITGNWGATNLTAGERAIATGKNWVIVG